MSKNKGFSLVELIIVIAIIAILSAALAPQIMKYIEKARVSTDKRTCQSLKSCLYAALTNDDVWNDMGIYRQRDFKIYLRMSDDNSKMLIAGLLYNDDSATEIRKIVTNLENPKQTGMESYEILIEVKKNTITNDDGTITNTFSIGDIVVQTSSFKFNTDINDAIYVD